MTRSPTPPWCTPPPWLCRPPWWWYTPPPWWCSPPMPAPTSSDETNKARSEQGAKRAIPPAAAGCSRKTARESPGDGDGPSTEPRGHQQPPLEAEVECEEKPSRAATGVNVPPIPREVDEDDYTTDSENRLSSGAAGNGGYKERYNGDDSAQFSNCTVCQTRMFSASEVHEHPTLHGLGICSDCFDFLFRAPFTRNKKDGSEEQCRWCGVGGVVILCNTCDKVFCQRCIVINCGGRRGLNQILSRSKWSYFCCNPEPLRVHVDKLKAFLQSVPPGINYIPLSDIKEMQGFP